MYPFSEGSFAPRDGWYVAAFPHEITRTPLERWILNEPVALYRRVDGGAVAVGGRCPHRHFPLGKSKLVGDNIECGYHGITFGPDGRCTRIPSQALIPPVLRIRRYPLVEKGLWTWIWPGNPDRADESLIPTPEEIGLTAPDLVARPFYSLHVKGRYQLLNDNLLDLSHLGFLHRTTIGTEENATAPELRELDTRRLRARRHMKCATGPKVVTDLYNYAGPIDRLSGMDFFFPGFHSGIEERRISHTDPARGGELISATKIWHAVTPAVTDETLYFFAMSAASPEKLDFMYQYLQPVIGEDVFATEEIEKILRRLGDPPAELMLKSDANAVQGRRILQTMMDAERSGSN